MGDGAGLNRGLMSAKLSRHKIRRENDNICDATDLSGNSREKCHARCVHTSVHGSFCSVLAKLVFPLTSELRGGIGTRKPEERHRGTVMNGVQGC